MAGWRQQIDQHIVKPAAIQGLRNGELPGSVLVDVRNGDGVRIGRLCAPAARSWTAMVAAAREDGIVLDATDTYRSEPVQREIFVDRYRSTDQGNGSRVCGGKTWYLRKGKATAACPGTSNHGWGLAVDNRFHGPGLAWLETHARRFGWAWEVSTEDWHIHFMPGDQLPQAVLDFEAGHTTVQEDDMRIIQVTDGPDTGVWLVVGNVRRVQTKESADHLTKGGVPYFMMDGEGFAQVAVMTELSVKDL